MLLVCACGDDDSATDAGSDSSLGDGGPQPQDAETDAEPDAGMADYPAQLGELADDVGQGVRREIFLVPAPSPPPNPTTDESTPSELNATQVLRYRRAGESPLPARAIVIAVPGFLGGGGSFHGLARSLVEQGLDDEPIEVWAIDRRSNLLEDLRGMNAAEVAGMPEIATEYYAGRATIGSEAFGGFVAQSDVGYMSEWGLATHVRDLRAVLALIAQEHRRGRVFLLGHSLGASLVEAYGAWRFADESRGFDEIAGFILVDGIGAATAISETEYIDGFMGGFFSSPGLDALRQGPRGRYSELPLLGIEVYELAEIMALRVLADPSGVIEDVRRKRVFSILTGLRINQVPRATNAAALGLGFDDESAPLGFIRARLGSFVGPAEEYTSAFGDEVLRRPSDPDATYEWSDAPDNEETTPLNDMAEALTDGRSNFAEWYFPARLSLDLAASGGFSIPEDGYQADQGIRTFDGALNDAPFLCLPAALVGDVTSCDAVRERIAPAVGPSRPQAAALRTEIAGFETVDATGHAHLDLPISASEANPAPAAIRAFLSRHTQPGTVTIPAMIGDP